MEALLVEGEPLLNFESEDDKEVLKDEHEFMTHEKEELIIETGHIAVNPLADDHNFVATDNDEDDNDNV